MSEGRREGRKADRQVKEERVREGRKKEVIGDREEGSQEFSRKGRVQDGERKTERQSRKRMDEGRQDEDEKK